MTLKRTQIDVMYFLRCMHPTRNETSFRVAVCVNCTSSVQEDEQPYKTPDGVDATSFKAETIEIKTTQESFVIDEDLLVN